MCESILCFPFCQRAARLSYFFALFAEKSRILRAVGRVGSVLVAEKKKRSKHRKCSHTSENRPPLSLRAVAGCLLGKAPNPCSERTVNEWQTEHETLCCASL